MSVYLFCLVLGFLGLLIMAVGGLGQHGHGGHGHAGHDVGDVSLHGGHAHAHAGDHGAHSHAAGGKDGVPGLLTSLLSPRVMFSVLVGTGAVGLLVEPWLGGMAQAALAVAGGIGFEKLLVGPFWNFLFRFASAPARTLESAVLDPATAVTGFDEGGDGLVAIELDGQVVQLLGTLCREDRDAGVRVRAGDPLTVQEVDGARNRCVVSRAGV